jgi:hypothetical protein
LEIVDDFSLTASDVVAGPANMVELDTAVDWELAGDL